MPGSINNPGRDYRLLPALVAGVVFGALSSAAADLAAIHLPDKTAPDAEVGLALSAPDTLYAAHWAEPVRDQPWRLLIYKLKIPSGKILAQSEIHDAEPIRSRNGDLIQSSIRLSISPDGSMLLLTTLERGAVRKVWTLSSRDLHILSSRTIPAGTDLLGFSENGDVRLLRTHTGGNTGQQINSETVLDLAASLLDKGISEQLIKFQEPAWRLTAVGPDNLLWALDERVSQHSEARITAYRLPNGESVATQEVSLAAAQAGAPATAPRPRGGELPPPTAIPQPGISHDAPQVAQMMAATQMVLGVIHQPAGQWRAWSRVMRVGVDPQQITWSSILTDCNLRLDAIGRSGRMAVGVCDMVARGHFDRYEIGKSDAVFVSTQTGSIEAVLPLDIPGPPLSLALDDTVDPALAAIYDRRATVRVLSIPSK